MAVGITQGTVTTTTGETIELSWLVDDTVSPTKWWNACHPVNSAGNSAAFGTGVVGVTVPRVTLATDVAVPISAAASSIADGALVTLGAKADAKSTATDTTSITLMQVAKQISASAQLIVTALGSTALDLGASTGGSRTLRVAIDTAQTEGSEYEFVDVSATTQTIGAAGAAGDYLSHVIISPQTAGCGVVTIFDNTSPLVSFPGGGTTALPTVAPFTIPIGITSTAGAWKITTGANVKCTAVGNFT